MPVSTKLDIEQLSSYFHMPINEAAKELGICATVLKKICRKNDIPRWPHRRLKSIDKKIKELESTQDKPGRIDEGIQEELKHLKNLRSLLLKQPLRKHKKAQKGKDQILARCASDDNLAQFSRGGSRDECVEAARDLLSFSVYPQPRSPSPNDCCSMSNAPHSPSFLVPFTSQSFGPTDCHSLGAHVNRTAPRPLIPAPCAATGYGVYSSHAVPEYAARSALPNFSHPLIRQTSNTHVPVTPRSQTPYSPQPAVPSFPVLPPPYPDAQGYQYQQKSSIPSSTPFPASITRSPPLSPFPQSNHCSSSVNHCSSTGARSINLFLSSKQPAKEHILDDLPFVKLPLPMAASHMPSLKSSATTSSLAMPLGCRARPPLEPNLYQFSTVTEYDRVSKEKLTQSWMLPSISSDGSLH